MNHAGKSLAEVESAGSAQELSVKVPELSLDKVRLPLLVLENVPVDVNEKRPFPEDDVGLVAVVAQTPQASQLNRTVPPLVLQFPTPVHRQVALLFVRVHAPELPP